MKHWFVLFVFFWLLLPVTVPGVFAQAVSDPETAGKARFVFNFDARNTFLEKAPVRVSGLKAGVEWHNKFRTGVGYYFIRKPMVIPFSSQDLLAGEARVKFSYAAVYGEYVLLKNEKWELSLPVQVGFGKLKNQHYNASGTLLQAETKPLYLVEPSVSGHYKIFYWAGIGAGTGYRHMLGQTSRETGNLNAPVYYVKVKIFLGELYRELRQKHSVPGPEEQ